MMVKKSGGKNKLGKKKNHRSWKKSGGEKKRVGKKNVIKKLKKKSVCKKG